MKWNLIGYWKWNAGSASPAEAARNGFGTRLAGLAALCVSNAGAMAQAAAPQPQLMPPIIVIGPHDPLAGDWTSGSLPGYALRHLETGYRFNRHFLALAGVENVLDERYTDHPGGINRVAGGDVAVGQRIPGAGRFVSASANVSC